MPKGSSDINEFTQRKPKLCKLGRHLQSLGEPDLKEKYDRLQVALATDGVSNLRIAHVLTDWSYPVSETLVWKHRTGECCCAK